VTNVIALLRVSNLLLRDTSRKGLTLAASVIFHIGIESQFLSGLIREHEFCDFSVSSLRCLSVLLDTSLYYGNVFQLVFASWRGWIALFFLLSFSCHFFE